VRSSLERSKRDHPANFQGTLGGPAYSAPGCSAGKRSAARVASHPLRARLCKLATVPRYV